MIKLGSSFWWVLILIGVSIFVSNIPELAGDPIYTRLTVFLLVLFVVAGLWSIFSMVGVEVYRKSRTPRKQVGEIFSENFEIVNRSIIPKVWLKVTDQVELSGRSGSRVLTWVRGRHSRNYIAYSLLDKRGWFQLGPTKIITGDLFGIFSLRKSFEPRWRLLVYPYMVNLQSFPVPYGILPGGRALRQKTLDVTPYAAGVREFVPGDPLKRIHWPTSARKQKLIVKEFEKDPLAEVWIFLDAKAGVHYHGKKEDLPGLEEFWWLKQKRIFRLPPDTEEYAISIAASIAKYYISQNRQVGLVSAAQRYSIIPAEQGERQLGKILETLAVLRAEGQISLWGLINSQWNHLARGSTVVLITPSGDERLLIVIIEMLQRGLVPVVVLIDQASFGGDHQVDDLEAKLIKSGVLTFVVREGEDLKTILEAPIYANYSELSTFRRN